jgi:hypothetical protein
MSRTEQQKLRILALEQRGCFLVHAADERQELVPGPDGQNLIRPVPSLYRFEHSFRGSMHSIVQHTLEAALDAAEAEMDRIEALGGRAIEVRTGPETQTR